MRALLFALLLPLITPVRSWAQSDHSPAPVPATTSAQQILTADEARAARVRIDVKLGELAARERSIKTTAPLASTIASATLLAVSIGGLVWSQTIATLNSDGIRGDESKNDRLRLNSFGAAVPISALALIVSWSMLGKRRAERKAVRREADELRSERQQLDLLVAPAVGLTSYGLSLTSRF